MKIDIKARWTGAVLFSLDVEINSVRITLEAAVKARAYLADADLADAYLADAYLADANLSGANLADANLSGANLTDANLADAYLSGANLAGADLAGAYLADANLADAYLSGANLAGADLAGAYLADAYLSGANLAGANLADANLARANLTDANLADAYLSGANLAGAYLAGAYLADANLADAYLSGANLAGADLADANLADANLADAYLSGANLSGANLAGADQGEAAPREALRSHEACRLCSSRRTLSRNASGHSRRAKLGRRDPRRSHNRRRQTRHVELAHLRNDALPRWMGDHVGGRSGPRVGRPVRSMPSGAELSLSRASTGRAPYFFASTETVRCRTSKHALRRPSLRHDPPIPIRRHARNHRRADRAVVCGAVMELKLTTGEKVVIGVCAILYCLMLTPLLG